MSLWPSGVPQHFHGDGAVQQDLGEFVFRRALGTGMAAHADPLFAGAHPEPVALGANGAAGGIQQLHAKRPIGGGLNVKRAIALHRRLPEGNRRAVRAARVNPYGAHIAGDGSFRLPGVEAKQVSGGPCGHQGGGKLAGRNARGHHGRFDGIGFAAPPRSATIQRAAEISAIGPAGSPFGWATSAWAASAEANRARRQPALKITSPEEIWRAPARSGPWSQRSDSTPVPSG